jgi:hypothetical protein
VPTIYFFHAGFLHSAEPNHEKVLRRLSPGPTDSRRRSPAWPQPVHPCAWSLGAGLPGAICNAGRSTPAGTPSEILEVTPINPGTDGPSCWLERPGAPGRSGVRVSSCLPFISFMPAFYILQSLTTKKFYVGSALDFRRLCVIITEASGSGGLSFAGLSWVAHDQEAITV